MHLADIADRRLQRRERGAARDGRVRAEVAARGAARGRRARVRQRRGDAHRGVGAPGAGAMVDGDTLRTMLAALRRLLKVTPINTVGAAAPARGRDRRARRRIRLA